MIAATKASLAACAPGSRLPLRERSYPARCRVRARFACISAAVLVLFATPCLAAELELRYSALERILGEQVFTQEGRRYVRGAKTTPCQFAYLEMPHLSSDNGRLRVAAKFTGRSALDLFGHCVGMGDSFDLALAATPFARDGTIALKDVAVTSIRDSYYIRRVRAALAQSVSKDLKIEIRDQARKLLQQNAPAVYTQEMTTFDLRDVEVLPEALLLVVELRIVVK